MRWPAYLKYKPSGVDWLGEVPEGWEVKRLKGLAAYWVSNVDKARIKGDVGTLRTLKLKRKGIRS